MNKTDLIAPATYNIVNEMEKYADGSGKKRLFGWMKKVIEKNVRMMI